MGKLGNFLALQAVWFACVLGAAHGADWVGPLVALALFALHLTLHAAPRAELRLALVVTPLGWAIDSAQHAAGWIDYAGWAPLGALAPVWSSSGWGLMRKAQYSLFAFSIAALGVFLVIWKVVFSATA